ncbi:hypothetical protein Tco_0635441 [Tanacetum coccineum]
MNWGEVNPVHAYYNGSCTSKDTEDPSWSTSFKTRRTRKTSSALEALWKTLFVLYLYLIGTFWSSSRIWHTLPLDSVHMNVNDNNSSSRTWVRVIFEILIHVEVYMWLHFKEGYVMDYCSSIFINVVRMDACETGYDSLQRRKNITTASSINEVDLKQGKFLLFVLSEKVFVLLVASEIKHLVPLALYDIGLFEDVIMKTVDYCLFDVVVGFHRFIFLIVRNGGYFEYWKAGLVVVGDDYISTLGEALAL